MSYPLGSAHSDQSAEYYAEPEEGEARPRFRVALTGLVVLVVIGLFSGGLWFAYLEGQRHAGGSISAANGNVPLIRADPRPTRVKPENPGGMEIPDRDKLIYTQKRATVEHLLPPPEKPMPRPAAPSAAAQPETPSSPTSPTPSAAPTPAKPQTAEKPSSPVVAQSPPPKAGGARLQLGSVRSEEAARQEWDRLKRANSDLLGGLSATPIRADLGDKGVFYRILAGPVADPDRICRELARRNIGCIIAR